MPRRRISSLLVLMLTIAACAVPAPPVLAPATSPNLARLDGRIGVEAGFEFIDVAKTVRPFERFDGKRAPTDAHGWPTADARSVIFDMRPAFAWAPPVDDPTAFQPDMSGTYRLTLRGRATIGAIGPASVSHVAYTPDTNTTSADVFLAPGAPALMMLTFHKTRRTPSSPLGSGFTDLRIIRPGYPADTAEVFTDRLLDAYKPFAFLRFMDAAGTNQNQGAYTDRGHHLLAWNERALPDDATQEPDLALRAGKRGVAWEYVVLLANRIGKDVWINLPVSASGNDPADEVGYAAQLARLLRDGSEATGGVGLRPELAIYIEHSNEVWHEAFPQHGWNRAAAEDEAIADGATLRAGGAADPEVWAQRRHGRRVYELAAIFAAAFGADAFPARVRPVYTGSAIDPDSYDDVLSWLAQQYGPPSTYLYAIAASSYFDDDPVKVKGAAPASVDDVLAAMRADSLRAVAEIFPLRAIATRYGLRLAAYEGGPDNGGGSAINIAARIAANRDPRMQALLEEHISDRWFGSGGDLYSHFNLVGLYQRHGCWGLVETLADLDTPKYRAILRLVGAEDTPGR